ncbi:MAG: hypothetical protein JXA09_07975 [Anaerolineae bacterium]|nr:hypothetical protein [Anaerolineae bacterium]
MVRRLSFLAGLLVGSGLCAWLLGTALIYLFTGKILALHVGEDGVQFALHDRAYGVIVPREEV